MSATTDAELADASLRAGRDRRPERITAIAVHGLMTAVNDAAFRDILGTFDALASPPIHSPLRISRRRSFGIA